MKAIKILGGGISGLTAAINLKKAGFNVEVYEKKNYCGKPTNDFQFLENWIYNEDVLSSLRKINIKTDFYIKPWRNQEILAPSLRRYSGESSNNLMYLIKRGKIKDSIDRSLEMQAKNNEVKIIYNSKLKLSQADIIAIGPKKSTFIATGIKFKLKHLDRNICILDNNLSLKVYSYFIVNDNIGEIVCINPVGIKDCKSRLGMTVKIFEKVLNTKIKNIEENFSGIVNFDFMHKAKINNQYFLGEAAGFQDCLFGFGMVYAFKSGYCAAKSIIEDTDYNELWKKDFLKYLKISSNNRKVYEKLSNKNFEELIKLLNSENPIIKKLRGGGDIQNIMKVIYNHSIPSFSRHLLL